MKWITTILATTLALASFVRTRESVEDAARIARNLIQTSSIGTLSSVYPSNHTFAGQPFALMEYYAPCHTNGSLTFLFFPISLNGRNILASSSHSATFAIQTPPGGYSLANKPRVALVGNVELFGRGEGREVEECYKGVHRDVWWVPGNRGGVHDAVWARFDPHTIYFVGGFSGQHYIGHIPLELYQKAIPTSSTNDKKDGVKDEMWRLSILWRDW